MTALRTISLGAGVQSSTMALMAAHGELEPMPDCAIFADTQWEPKAVYAWLDWLETQLPFPVYRVTAGNIRDNILRSAEWHSHNSRFVAVPFFTDSGGMGRRQCTREYKLEPLIKKQRELLGIAKGERAPKNICAEVWIGISTDEASRMKPAWLKWQANRWPLIERGMSRDDCITWMELHGYPRPPKSSCIGCPYHDDGLWREIRDNDPDAWRDAVFVDKRIREGGTLKGMTAQQFMHRSLKPLDEVDLRTPAEWGQLNLFENECEGMCGV